MTSTAFSRSGLDRLRETMTAAIDTGDVPGMVLLLDRHGETWIEALGVQDLATRTPMSPATIFRIASMTKPITATAVMILVEDGRLDLDAPVDPWMPELAQRRVVRSLDGPLEETVPAHRPITTRDLLTMQWGLGAIMAGDDAPLARGMVETGVSVGAFPPALPPDEWLRRLGSLPLAHQPGEGWLYHTGFDVLNVLVMRVAGVPAGELMEERIFDPLGMVDTGFRVPPESLDRLATCYERNPDDSALVVADPAGGGVWAGPPVFASELVSTASDYLTFVRMLLGRGEYPNGRILAPATVDLMARDHIPERVKAVSPFFPGFWESNGWGFGMCIRTAPPVGAIGWSGGFNTHWMSDPASGLTGLLLMQVQMPALDEVVGDFWRLAYDAIAD